jgi:hypothetical protein
VSSVIGTVAKAAGGGWIAGIEEIVSKVLTIAASPGGLEWLQNHVRSNEEFNAKYKQAAVDALMKELQQPNPPPKE